MHPGTEMSGCFCSPADENFLTVCLLTLFVAASCSWEQSLSGLNEVGSYINEHPEAALAALDSLSSTGEIRGKEANAKFAQWKVLYWHNHMRRMPRTILMSKGWGKAMHRDYIYYGMTKTNTTNGVMWTK